MTQLTQPFTLHPRLAADGAVVADWGLSRVLLLEDARFPWLALVPRRVGAVEVHGLAAADRMVLMDEIARAAAALETVTLETGAPCDKINIGALGNLVPQLHVHVVARRRDDAAWPGPVWGAGQAVPYEPAARAALIARLRAASGTAPSP